MTRLRFAGLAASLFLVAAVIVRAEVTGARKIAASAAPVELGEVWGPENDAQADEIVNENLKLLAARAKGDTVVRRDAHPKHHGCVKAFFKVDAELPAEVRSGVFAAPTPAQFPDGYPAWIRLSNGDPDGAKAPDSKRDIRGFAVKLMNIEGADSGSQDFVMCSGERFFSKDGADYLGLHRALAKSGLAVGAYMALHPHDALNFLRAQVVPPNPLQIEYYSSLPYKLGQGSMRFKVKPCPGGPDDPAPEKSASTNYLRERLVATLAKGPACYEFYVQPNRDPRRQPVEDPRVGWRESRNPYVKVGTITIPRQEGIDSEAQLNFCENLTFNPWHTLPGTRPLGQIGRMRGIIYPAIAEFRHRSNHVPIIEPRSHDACGSETAPLCQAPRR